MKGNGLGNLKNTRKCRLLVLSKSAIEEREVGVERIGEVGDGRESFFEQPQNATWIIKFNNHVPVVFIGNDEFPDGEFEGSGAMESFREKSEECLSNLRSFELHGMDREMCLKYRASVSLGQEFYLRLQESSRCGGRHCPDR